jgi:hypothetical protein
MSSEVLTFPELNIPEELSVEENNYFIRLQGLQSSIGDSSDIDSSGYRIFYLSKKYRLNSLFSNKEFQIYQFTFYISPDLSMKSILGKTRIASNRIHPLKYNIVNHWKYENIPTLRSVWKTLAKWNFLLTERLA